MRHHTEKEDESRNELLRKKEGPEKDFLFSRNKLGYPK